ncbi:hypothetical protein SCHPADRAFT_592618 [Schizopora paradoxa]|uniref:Uncharacterized protein n=1 Tax=Schizopora paradoxa TaxID=27342 RepID=A0A0H2RVI8_9AGAM|nr:hypothetical protein SCHPADRAFT_592618 [Schizopora paradoxa]
MGLLGLGAIGTRARSTTWGRGWVCYEWLHISTGNCLLTVELHSDVLCSCSMPGSTIVDTWQATRSNLFCLDSHVELLIYSTEQRHARTAEPDS